MGFKKYNGSTWQPITPKKLKGIPYTGTLPAVLTGTKAGYLHRYKIYGNLTQNGTPTPENPIVPSECGEMETTGAHAGQYKLPLASAGQNVDIYLGESQTTRRIKKLVLTGAENWLFYQDVSGSWQFYVSDMRLKGKFLSSCLSNIAPYGVIATTRTDYDYGCYLVTSGTGVAFQMRGAKDTLTNATAWKSYLATQYAAGTPVTVWYVLAEPETAVVNKPLMKIDDYADTIDSTQTTAQVPTTAGSTTISWAGEGLAPSEFDSIQEWEDTPTYTYTNGAWVEDN